MQTGARTFVPPGFAFGFPAPPLQGLLPPKARLLLGDGSWREVPSESVAAGDVLTVLPGDRVPVDGVRVSGLPACLPGRPACGSCARVWAMHMAAIPLLEVELKEHDCTLLLPLLQVVVGGRSTVDESALTGEPLPVTKTQGERPLASTAACLQWQALVAGTALAAHLSHPPFH